MKKILYFLKDLNRSLKVTICILLIFPYILQSQNKISRPFGNKPSNAFMSFPQSPTNKTAATTCPTSAVLSAQDSTNYVNGGATVIGSGSTLACNNQSIIIYPSNGTTSNENTPCVSTTYATYYTNIRNNITETFYEGGQNIGCVGPSGCAFPIGGTPNTGINGFSSWSVLLGYLDPSLQHDFTFCRGAGNITSTTVSLIDCWTGATLAGPNTLSNATAGANSTPCFTMTLPANTSIGSAAYSIAPASASSSLINFGDGEAQIKIFQLPAGTYTVTYTFTPPASSGCAAITGTYKFTVGPNPTVNVTSPTVCSGITPTITASGTSTSYSWSPSTNLSSSTGTSVTYNGTTSTTYTVTGMKGGCSATATSTVTINPTPTVTVNSDSICVGATTTLTANGATSYNWSPGSGLSSTTGSMVTANPSATTIYTITGTSATCTSTATSTVTIRPTATISVTSATVCPGGTGTLTASGASTYSWNPATGLNSSTGSTVQANPSSTTVYTVTGNIGVCPATPGTSTLTVSSIGSLTTSNDTTICPSTSATLTVSGATTYTWNPSTGLSTTTGSMVIANPTSTTSYTITGTTGGCTSQGVITVTVSPVLTVSVNSASICLGDSATLKATGATTYSWTTSAGLNTTVGDSVKASPSTLTVYTVTGTTGFCSASATSTVTIISSPTIAVSANPSSICVGGSSTLTATGVTSYTWTADPTLSTTTGSVTVATPTLSTTSYTVSGSVGTCSAVPAVVTVTVVSSPTLTVSNDTTICSGNPVTLMASGATSYTWVTASPPALVATTATVSVNPSNTQTYYVQGAIGSCSSVDSVKITVNQAPTVSINNSGAICAGQQTATLTANGAINYTWTPSATLSSNTGTVVTANPTVTTSYSVTGVDGNGCSNIGTTTLTVNQPPVISVASASICIGSTDSLAASGAVSYSWSPSATLSSNTGTSVAANPTVTTTYTIAGIDANSCISSTTATITINNLPVVSASSGTACVGSTTTLTATGANTYVWSPATGLSSSTGSSVVATPSSTVTPVYTVTGTDANNCVNTTTTNVTANPLPPIDAGTNQAICKGDSVHLSATGADTYVWTPSAGLTSSTIANPSGAPASTTNYTVTGTYTATGCKNKDVVTITTSSVSAVISANPTVGEAPLTVDFTNTSAGATTYTWTYGNGNTQVTTGLAGTQEIYQNQGTYTVTMVAANAAGCTDVTSTIIIVSEGYSISIPNIFTPNGDGINDNFFVKSSGVTSMAITIFDRWGLKMWESSSVTGTWDGRNGSKEVNDGTYFYVISATSSKGVTQTYKGNVTVVK